MLYLWDNFDLVWYLGKKNWSIRSVSEKAMLSREGKYSVMVIGRGLLFSLFGEIHIRQGDDL